MISNIPHVCSDMSIINDPRIIYHQDAATMKNMPTVDAAVPNAVKVSAEPRTNIRERRKAFRVSLPAVPAIYPIIRGILDTAHGVRDVSAPAAKARNGAYVIFYQKGYAFKGQSYHLIPDKINGYFRNHLSSSLIRRNTLIFSPCRQKKQLYFPALSTPRSNNLPLM